MYNHIQDCGVGWKGMIMSYMFGREQDIYDWERVSERFSLYVLIQQKHTNMFHDFPECIIFDQIMVL